MLLKKVFLSLVLAPSAPATPVFGQEIVVRELERKEADRWELFHYKPTFNLLCLQRGYDYSPAAGRSCVDGQSFRFQCARGHYADLEGRKKRFAAEDKCSSTHFCLEVIADGEDINVPDADYTGAKDVICVNLQQKLKATAKASEPTAQTGRSNLPPGPTGTMYGNLVLSGNVKGFRPAMDWKYVDRTRPGVNLLGQRVIKNGENDLASNTYMMKYNYANEAQFIGAVEYLSPKHGLDISLELNLAWLPTSIKARDVFEEIEEREISGAEEIEDGKTSNAEEIEDEETSGE